MRAYRGVEFILAVVITTLLIGTLLSQKLLHISPFFVSILIGAFVIVKIADITRRKGTIFEDYIALGIIALYGTINLFIDGTSNPIVITSVIFLLIYSTGLIPWISEIIKSKKVVTFILSYIFFVIIIIFLFAGMFSTNPGLFQYNGEKTAVNFEDALYFSTITFTTIGYGDIAPTGINKLIASIEGIFGMILNIWFIGYILASRRFKDQQSKIK